MLTLPSSALETLFFHLYNGELGIYNVFPMAGWMPTLGHELEGTGPGVGQSVTSLTFPPVRVWEHRFPGPASLRATQDSL